MMQYCFDREEIEHAEQVRTQLHKSLMYTLKQYGIKYKDKSDAERIAWLIVNS